MEPQATETGGLMSTCYNCEYYKGPHDGRGLCYRYPPIPIVASTIEPNKTLIVEGAQVFAYPAFYVPEVESERDECGEFKQAHWKK
jgi:hypothetical protein